MTAARIGGRWAGLDVRLGGWGGGHHGQRPRLRAVAWSRRSTGGHAGGEVIRLSVRMWVRRCWRAP